VRERYSEAWIEVRKWNSSLCSPKKSRKEKVYQPTYRKNEKNPDEKNLCGRRAT